MVATLAADFRADVAALRRTKYREGYDQDEVDDLCDLVVAALR